MLPLIAREVLSGGPTLYGLLLAAVGAGAVGGALVLPKIKAKLGADRTVAAGTIGTALVMMLLAVVPSQITAIAAAGLAGLSWIAVLSSVNVAAQTSLPDWVRARGLSVFLTVFFGSMSAGSLAWGQIASIWGIPIALIAAAVGAVVIIPLTRSAKLGLGAAQDLTPSMHWPEPVISQDVVPDGPVMVQITYRVPEANRAEFMSLIQNLASSRRRGGGYRWAVMQDAAEPEVFVETWWEASWLDHERQHLRVSHEDQALQNRITAVLVPGSKTDVHHFLQGKA
jgi:MFS family permease